MKSEAKTSIKANPAHIWKTIGSTKNWADWNSLFSAVQGEFQLDSKITAKELHPVLGVKQIQPIVTGLRPDKYLSFSWNHSWGAWWYSEEHVFRIKTDDSDEITLFYEVYYYGQRFRFGKADLQRQMDNLVSRSMDELEQIIQK